MRAPVISLLTIAAIACTENRGSNSNNSTRDSAGIAIVESATPAWSDNRRWSVDSTAVLVLGVLDSPAVAAFSRITTALRTRDNRLIVADGAARELRFFDSDGRFIRTAGRGGAGPGEYQVITRIFELERDSLLVYDAGMRRYSVLSPAGDFVRSFATGGAFDWPASYLGDGALLYARAQGMLSGASPGVTRDLATYNIADLQGNQLYTIGQFGLGHRHTSQLGQVRRQLTIPFAVYAPAAGRGERIFVCECDSYQIAEYRPNGALVALIRPGRERRPISDQHIAQYLAELPATTHPVRRRGETELLAQRATRPRYFPAFSALMLDATDHLWALEYQAPGDATAHWSILDQRGSWLGEVALPADLRVLQIGEDFILAVQQTPEGFEQLHLYRLRR